MESFVLKISFFADDHDHAEKIKDLAVDAIKAELVLGIDFEYELKED